MIMEYLILIPFFLPFAAYIRLMYMREDCVYLLDIEEDKQESEKSVDKWVNWSSNYFSKRLLIPIARKSEDEKTNKLIRKYNRYVSILWWSLLALVIGVIILIIVINL